VSEVKSLVSAAERVAEQSELPVRKRTLRGLFCQAFEFL
jgi:hypothetical protein